MKRSFGGEVYIEKYFLRFITTSKVIRNFFVIVLILFRKFELAEGR